MIDDEEPESTSERVPEYSDERLSCGSAHNCLPIVGIGASAGGLDALRTLFTAMPADTGIGFVVTQHLDADHHSLLADLLAKYTSMQVVQVEDGMSVEANRIYVIPPNTYMTITGGILLLKPPADARGKRMPIDRFLISLARDRHEHAIGIILSGTGTDGTLGVREIKANGGMVLVQDPESAQYDGMPRSAIATGRSDAVLSLESIPEVLLNYTRHAYKAHEIQPSASLEPGHDAETAILSLLLAKTGHDFRCYKKGTLVRRIHRRMGITGAARVEDYLALLRERDEEIRALSKDLFIGVTSFFRETEAWSAIVVQVVDPIVASYAGDGPVRVWVPGCATGEEAYTLAILFAEAFERANKSIKLVVFGTDVDTDAIQAGRAGLYHANIAENLSPERLSRFFSKEGDDYRVEKSLRDLVVFTAQNLITDPPFSKLDLVSCRNLLIYLEPRLQEKILHVFHFALKPGGFLVLGSSESLGSQQQEFRALSKKWRIFQPDGRSQLGLVEMPISRDAKRSVPRFPAQGRARREPRLADLAQQALVETFTPASVLVTRRYQVLYVYGDTSDYLVHPPGELTDDLMSVTRSELRLKTRAAMHQAISENRQLIVHGAKVMRGEAVLPVAITVTPLQRPPPVAGLLLVSFHREPEEAPRTTALDPGQGPEAEIVRRLEDELKITREELQSTIEELETSNEELKASNEEAMSMNEELQSSNEELETSKEELQSLNEELTTVNNQLQNKVVEVESTSNDLSNLLSSSNVATLFLDRDLRIKRFTPATTKLMNLIPADLGRPVTDIASKYADNDLKEDCLEVLDELQPVEREIASDGGEWHIRRVQPYRTQDNRIEGTVITFSDVSAIKRRDLEHARLANIVESSENTIIGMSLDGIITSWNQGGETTYGYREDEVIGKSLDPLFPDRNRGEAARILREIGAGRRVGPYETLGLRKDGTLVELSVSVSPICDGTGHTIAASTIARDISRSKRVERALVDADQRKNEFLAMLGHELRNPLAPIRNAVDVLALQKGLPEKVRWAADVIRRQSEQLERLVNDLLDVSRITRGDIQLKKQAVAVQECLENALLNVAHLVEQAHHTVETRLLEEPVVVMGDSVRLTQVFTNLLSNAIRYTPNRGHILIALAQEAGKAVVRVRDNGEGIRFEDMVGLFDLFSRVHREHHGRRGAEGLGLGLTLARRLIEQHGGVLEGHSDGLGKGSEFVATLPICSQIAQAGSPSGRESTLKAEPRARRILVVDDEAIISMSLQVLLESMGHHVRTLNMGREAITVIRDFHPEIVFLDIGMPDMNGYEVAISIRSATLDSQPLLVAVTGYGGDSDRAEAKKAGFDQFLLKPLAREQIETLLDELGERSSAIHTNTLRNASSDEA